jgi:F420-non-reducing hydrogenase small subunit
MVEQFALLQLSGCSGCEVSFLNADDWVDARRLLYMPFVLSRDDIPDVDTLLVTGAVYTEDDLARLKAAVGHARQVVAVGTCAVSGGVANLGARDEVRELFLDTMARRNVPRLLGKSRGIDTVVPVDRYLTGCPPTPELFMALLFSSETFRASRIVCAECGRKKTRDRPSRLLGFRGETVDPDICLINQGLLCVGSSTRGGCRAPCPRAGYPCVGCRGPSDSLIERSSGEWLEGIKRVFASLTDIPLEDVERGLLSPQFSLFVFQFADYTGTPRDRTKVF